MRTIVTGAAGFIGFHLCRKLLDAGHVVVGVDSILTGSEANARDLQRHDRFTLIRHDITRPFQVDGPVARIYNLACPASPVDFRDLAVEIMAVCSAGVRNMLDIAREKSAVFLQASTSECYGDPTEHPQPETYHGNVNPIGPRAPYDEGKRFAEALTMTYHRLHGLQTRMVRIFNTYGPRMRANDGRILPNFVNQAIDDKQLTVHGDGTQTRSFCYVDDLVDAIIRASECDFVEPINIGSEVEITVNQAAQAVIELTGSKSLIEYVPRPLNDPERRRPDLSRAKDILGWSPTKPWRDGFATTIDYFRAIRQPASSEMA